VLMCGAGLWQQAFAQDYFPLAPGNSWRYLAYEVSSMYFEGVRHDTAFSSVGDTLYMMPYFYRRDSAGNVYQRIHDVDYLLYKTRASVGSSWPFNAYTDPYSVTLDSRDATVKTFAGTFSGCLKFRFRCLSGGTDRDWAVWLAPGVGEVCNDHGIVGLSHSLRKAAIGADTLSAPYHVAPMNPRPDERGVPVTVPIAFYFQTIVDSNLVRDAVEVHSARKGRVQGNLFCYGNNFQVYTFYPLEPWPEDDEITITIRAGLRDIFDEYLDGDEDGVYEDAPIDNAAWSFHTSGISSIAGLMTPATSAGIVSVAPNPFCETMTIRYVVPGAGHVGIHLYDILGRKLVSSRTYAPAGGEYSFAWSGGDLLPVHERNGIYIVLLTFNGQSTGAFSVLKR
jgi:hypothetical protein